MNDLEKYFYENKKRPIYKYIHYFNIYDRHFSKYRGKNVKILEIGILGGGSLQMWKDYFGPHAMIYGIDIDPICKEYEENNIEIFIGSQSDKRFLESIKKNIGKIDIIIDDGGHMMDQQIISFEQLFDIINDDGVYLCEDTHTSYFLKFGGGLKRRGTFIEYCKNFIDYLHANYSEQVRFKPNKITKYVESVHFYDSIVVVEKKIKDVTEAMITGNEKHHHVSKYNNTTKAILLFVYKIVLGINAVLRFFRLPGFLLR